MIVESKVFGGALGRAIETHSRLVVEEADAQATVAAAQRDLDVAKDRGFKASVVAKVEGKTVELTTEVEDAETALRAAEYDLEASRRATLATMDQIAAEAQDASYDARLAKAEAPVKQKALNLMTQLESTLDELAVVKANRSWLKGPVKGDRLLQPTVQDVWIGADSVRRPNGDAARSRDLTRPLREALEDVQPGTNPAAQYGLPPGVPLVGPWGVAEPLKTPTMSGPAARAFEEQLGEAEEAALVLGDGV